MRRARVYVCGITPYETTHIGHAAKFVWSDVAVRLLRRLGLDVTVTRNITDVDDELVARAHRDGTSWRSMATQQTYRFEEDAARLGILTPTFEPQAHNYVDDVIELAAPLVDLGRATRLLSQHGGRPDDPDKDDALDAPLWLRSSEGEPGWPSPWGIGRPGWHAECTAMALSTFGPGIDLHCGGADLPSRTTRSKPRTARRCSGWHRSLEPGSGPGWPGTAARRWPSRGETSSSCATSSNNGRRRRSD